MADETTTVGEFLKEKLGNMARWVTEEVGKENLPVDIVQLTKDRSAVEVTVLAEVLNANSAKVTHRDWSALVRSLEAEDLPVDFTAVVQAVRAREHMHDKFWRYLELFREVLQNSHEERESDY